MTQAVWGPTDGVGPLFVLGEGVEEEVPASLAPVLWTTEEQRIRGVSSSFLELPLSLELGTLPDRDPGKARFQMRPSPTALVPLQKPVATGQIAWYFANLAEHGEGNPISRSRRSPITNP